MFKIEILFLKFKLIFSNSNINLTNKNEVIEITEEAKGIGVDDFVLEGCSLWLKKSA